MQEVTSSRWFKILKDDDGPDEVIDSGSDEVIIIAREDDGKLLMIEEPSAAFGTRVLLFPTGSIEAHEGVLEAAQRELREETGYAARVLTPLGALRPWSRYLKVVTNLVLAEGLYSAPLVGDEVHEILLRRKTSAEVFDLVKRGEPVDARVIAALALIR